jgi:hypothetical protein
MVINSFQIKETIKLLFPRASAFIINLKNLRRFTINFCYLSQYHFKIFLNIKNALNEPFFNFLS